MRAWAGWPAWVQSQDLGTGGGFQHLDLCRWPHEWGEFPRGRLPLQLPLEDTRKNQTSLKLLWPAYYFVMYRMVFPTSLETLRGWGLCPICLCILNSKHNAWYVNKQGINRSLIKDRCSSFLLQSPMLCQFHLHIQHDALPSLLLLLISEAPTKAQHPTALPPHIVPP